MLFFFLFSNSSKIPNLKQNSQKGLSWILELHQLSALKFKLMLEAPVYTSMFHLWNTQTHQDLKHELITTRSDFLHDQAYPLYPSSTTEKLPKQLRKDIVIHGSDQEPHSVPTKTSHKFYMAWGQQALRQMTSSPDFLVLQVYNF